MQTRMLCYCTTTTICITLEVLCTATILYYEALLIGNGTAEFNQLCSAVATSTEIIKLMSRTRAHARIGYRLFCSATTNLHTL